jgi:hypothetical protein
MDTAVHLLKPFLRRLGVEDLLNSTDKRNQVLTDLHLDQGLAKSITSLVCQVSSYPIKG